MQFDEPSGEYLSIAMRIIDSFLSEYGNIQHFYTLEGKLLE